MLPLSKIQKEYISEFSKSNGEVYLNTVYGGGAYTFLLNMANKKPILVIDIRNFKGKLQCDLHLKNNKKIIFCADSLEEVIHKFELKEVFINHIIWAAYFVELIDYLVELSSHIKINICFHDFFATCPTINLLNSNGIYCCIPDDKECNKCISRYEYSHRAPDFAQAQVSMYAKELNDDIANWRKLWTKLLDNVSRIYVPSKSAAKIFSAAYNNKYSDKIVVEKHSLDYIADIKPKKPKKIDSFLNLYIIGDIGFHKGDRELKQLIRRTADLNLNICYHILGSFYFPEYQDTPYLKLHGHFKHNNIGKILQKLNIDAFLFLSICPETFSYTLHEMMATKLPIIAFNIGAQGQFLKKYSKGIVIDRSSSDAVFQEVLQQYKQHKAELFPVANLNGVRKMNQEQGIKKLVKLVQERDFEIHEQINCISKLKRTIAGLKDRNTELDEHNKDITRSTSWRLTRPLRVFGDIVRSTKHKLLG